VDDFLVGETTLRRTFHRPKEHASNPLVSPGWEVMKSLLEAVS
jgi:hypothetical protein